VFCQSLFCLRLKRSLLPDWQGILKDAFSNHTGATCDDYFHEGKSNLKQVSRGTIGNVLAKKNPAGQPRTGGI
jgi:hypothetical protein